MNGAVTEDTLERRIVTVVFADLVGFTTLSEQFDAEDIAAIQDRYFATVRETVGRYGGRLEKFIGDAAMAVFGVPRSRDDDVVRAVRAGLALIHGVQQIGTALGLEEDTLRLRVGINTGEVVLAASGADEGRVTGDTVNTAARLQTAAPPGGVLVGETTALAVAEVADLEPVGALEMKGKAQPASAQLVTGLRSEPSREQAMGDLRAPTLGRERELATLQAALERAAAGSVERWLVVAPPGVGKSRVLRELGERIAAAGTPLLIWRARARAESVSPFDPIAALLRDAAAGVTGRAEAETMLLSRLVAAGAAGARARVVTDACLAVAWPTEVAAAGASSEERDALFAAWLDGLDVLAGGSTVVWLVEDLHWAGGDVLAFLELAGKRARAEPDTGRLVLATARPSLLESYPAWADHAPDERRHVLQLATLETTDARQLVAALVGDDLPAELVERITERSDGNCLFIEELLRTWVSVGTLVRDGNRWRLTVNAADIPLPASVQSIYAAQLDDLPPDARRLARRASVAGRRFPVGALQPLDSRSSGLDALRRRELVTGPLDEPIFGDAFAYRHALLRDAGYASLARAERARLHVRLARWLEQAAGERKADVAEQIARHYAAALESAPALAREVDDGLDRDACRRLAAEWFERAGDDTLSVAAHDAARQLFRRAIDLTPEASPADAARRWERLGDATAFAADMDEGAAAYQRAIELYRAAMAEANQELEQGMAELDDGLAEARAGLARATASMSNVMYQQLRFADSRTIAAQVAQELGPAADAASMARLLIAQAMGAMGAGGPAPHIVAEMEQAMELAQASGDGAIELRAMRGLTQARYESGTGDVSGWQQLEQSALKLGDWSTAVSASISAAMTLLDDDPASVYAAVERARQAATAHGRTESVGWSDYAEAEAAFGSGEWDRALDAGRRAADVGEANAYLRLTVRTWHVLIPIAAVRGDQALLERAARWYAALEGKFEFPDSPYSRVIRAAQDIELAAAGLWTPYVPEVEARIVSFAVEPGGPSWTAALDRVFRAWIEAGEVDGAGRALAAMTDALPGFGQISPMGRGTYELMRGRLAAALGESQTAVASGRAALELFRNPRLPWWMAKALRLLERIGAASHDEVDEALAIERKLGAVRPTA